MNLETANEGGTLRGLSHGLYITSVRPETFTGWFATESGSLYNIAAAGLPEIKIVHVLGECPYELRAYRDNGEYVVMLRFEREEDAWGALLETAGMLCTVIPRDHWLWEKVHSTMGEEDGRGEGSA